jgi:RLL motif-containing protein 1
MATISTSSGGGGGGGGRGGGNPPPSKRQRVAPSQSEDRRLMDGLSAPALRSRLGELAGLLEVDAGAVMRANGGGGGVDALVDACVRAVERFVAPFWMTHVDDAQNQNQTGGGGGGRGGRGGGRGGGGGGGRGGGGSGSGSGAGDSGGGSGSGDKTPAAASWNLTTTDFPSGIELGGAGAGAAVEAAVNVLRVLHVNDLRVLQSAVDALLVQMQEYTSVGLYNLNAVVTHRA